VSGRAVEAAGDVNTLLLDKTGTITIGNREATEFLPVNGVSAEKLADAAQLSSIADFTPEGRSITVLAKNAYGLRERGEGELPGAEFVQFTAQTRMSGVNLADGREVRKGAASSVAQWVRDNGGTPPEELGRTVDGISAVGGTPLVVAEKPSGSGPARALGVIYLKDIVKEGIAERFAEMRKMGIKTVMITGDNPLTAKAIADESGVDDFLAEATPEDKMALIKKEQEGGKLVAMTGDGTNDAPALAQADQAHPDRGDRQAAADHPRGADHVLDRERRREVLRDVAGHVLDRVPGPEQTQHPAPAQPGVRDHVGDHLQRADHRGADPAGAARRALPAGLGSVAAAQEPADLRRRRPDHPVRRDQAYRPHHPVHPRIPVICT
jgi:high-affinity K+ transport system ATPase subunit B